MIEVLTSAGYSIVEASWHSAAVLTKFYLITVLARNIDSLTIGGVQETILEESQIVLGVFLMTGITSLMMGLELRPRFTFVSEAIALGYLGYLFWEF